MSINTEIALVIDRSGSMHRVAHDTIGSVKQFIADQKKLEGNASLTMVQFDHAYEVIYDRADLNNVDADKFAEEYAPRGSTALLDAIGRTVIELGAKLDKLEKANQPKRVVVAIVTDGYENSSTEFTKQQIHELIKKQETEAQWDFVFLGATMDAVKVAQGLGFAAGKSAYYKASNVKGGLGTLCSWITSVRKGGEIEITQAERNDLAAG
jgi:uncharacterized protein YegL